MRITEPGFYKTRDGRKVHVVYVRTDADWEYPITGWVEGSPGYDNWTADGRLYYEGVDNGADLASEWAEPRTGTVWVNIDADGYQGSWPSRAEADQAAHTDRIACVRVDWTEGEGL